MTMHANADPKDGKQLKCHGGGDLSFCADCQNHTNPPEAMCYRAIASDQPGHTIVGCSAKIPVE